MSAVLTGGIEGVSARYAAQIRELLYTQAVRRMAADEEAARAEAAAAARAQRFEELSRSRIEEPVKVEIESVPATPHPEQARNATELAEPVRQPAQEAPPAEPLAQIIDVQA